MSSEYKPGSRLGIIVYVFNPSTLEAESKMNSRSARGLNSENHVSHHTHTHTHTLTHTMPAVFKKFPVMCVYVYSICAHVQGCVPASQKPGEEAMSPGPSLSASFR